MPASRYITIAFAVVAAGLPSVAYAYVDPGSGGAIITAILGAIGAVGWTIKKYYYKIKRLFSKPKDKQE